MNKIKAPNRLNPLQFVMSLLVISFLIIGCSSSTGIEPTPTDDTAISGKTSLMSPIEITTVSTDENKMMNTIERISATPRPIGSKEEKAICDLLKSELESYGYKTEVQEFPYILQNLKLKNTPFQTGNFFDFNISLPEGTSQNLMAVKQPAAPDSDDIIIVSAHYDTTNHSTGAIDNASGVAVLMEIARQIANYPSPQEVRFLLFSGEENYLYGSRYYVSKLTTDERKQIIANINIDCVGEEGINNAILGTSTGKENIVSQLFADYNIQIQKGPTSDNLSFEKAGIPSLTVAQYPIMDENGIDLPDNISRIDKTKLKIVADIVLKVLIQNQFQAH